MGMGLVAGLASVAACAPVDQGEPGTGTASEALNANPSRTAGTALASTHERNFGASCALWDTGRSREVVISAFGYKGASTTPTYLNTYDVYDDGATPTWTSSGTASTATAVAYPAAVTGKEVDGSGHLTTCYFAGGYDGTNLSDQVWKATVANGTVTWTSVTHMVRARAKFGLAVSGTSPNQKLIAIGGGFGSTRRDTIETFDFSSTWTEDTTAGHKLDQGVHSFGFAKLSDTKFVIAGGDGATNNPSAHINAIKVNSSGTVDAVGDILNLGSPVIDARKDNIVVPTGKTGLSGTAPVEILVSLGQTNGPALVTTTRTVVIDWNSGTTAPSYVSDAAPVNVAPQFQSPSTNLAFPTVVDAYVSPKNASSNPGYFVLGGINAASPQLAQTAIQKFAPSATGGTWVTATSFANGKVGVNAVYVKSIDKVVASAGTDRYPSSASSNDRLTTDLIQ